MSAAPARWRRLIWWLQSAGARGVFFVIRLLPFATASNVGGFLGRAIGPRLGISRRARRNLRTAFPDMDDDAREGIVRGMWDNLGRSLFEFPHLDRIRLYDPDGPVEMVGVEHLEALRDDGKPGLFFSGHLANWELGTLSAVQRGLPIHVVYRAPNNPFMQPLFARRHPGEGELIAKGAKGARATLRLLADGGHIAMLVDQKMNDGIAVPFFGRDAMTAPALAQLAIKFNCPMMPVRIERTGGARFRITFHPPFPVAATGNRQADILDTMTRVNALLEDWIRERPEQWLWLHNRWPD